MWLFIRFNLLSSGIRSITDLRSLFCIETTCYKTFHFVMKQAPE